jgi:hypothetical protein
VRFKFIRRKQMKRMFVATAILAMVIMVFTASAKADVSFVGLGNTGVDPYGQAWTWNNNGPAGASAWGIPGLLAGTLVWAGPATTDFDIVIGTKDTVPAGVAIDTTATQGNDYSGSYLTTRFSNVTAGALWNMVPVSPTEVQFFASNAATALVAGDTFFVNVVLTGKIDPTKVGFVATYSPVPVPPSLLLLAPGLLGLVGIRKRLKG